MDILWFIKISTLNSFYNVLIIIVSRCTFHYFIILQDFSTSSYRMHVLEPVVSFRSFDTLLHVFFINWFPLTLVVLVRWNGHQFSFFTAEVPKNKGVNSSWILIEKMSTNCDCAANIPNFCLLQGKAFGDTPKDKDSAIEVYTYCINETKKCLSFTENPVSKEKLWVILEDTEEWNKSLLVPPKKLCFKNNRLHWQHVSSIARLSVRNSSSFIVLYS